MIPPSAQLEKYFEEFGSIFPKGSLRSCWAMVCVCERISGYMEGEEGKNEEVNGVSQIQERLDRHHGAYLIAHRLG